MTQETEEQRHARWCREQEADEVAITLGLAFRSDKQGICYWRGNGDEFRAGYEAGKAAERAAFEDLTRTLLPPVAVSIADIDPDLLRDLLAKSPPMPLVPMPTEPDIAAAVAAEREACAQICDRRYDWSQNSIDGAEAAACAEAIRARGET